MKMKVKLNLKKLLLIGFHCMILLGILFCFLKYPEEIVDAKARLYAKMETEKSKTAVKFGNPEDYQSMEHTGTEWYQDTKLIYHAAGGIDGLDYSNSREAMELTLENGNRVVEVDFSYTSDGHLVCVRKWGDIAESGEPLTMADYLAMKIYGKYSPMTAEMVVDYMRRYPDLYIVIDYKADDYQRAIQDLVAISGQDSDVAERFIIQLYDRGDKEKALEAYPFPDENFLFTAYKYGSDLFEEILQICYDENVRVVTVPFEDWDQEKIDLLLSKNFVIYEHTVNRPDHMQRSMARGVHGIYTDFLTEESMAG